MCGRFTLTSSGEEVARFLELEQPPLFAPRYNIAPTQEIGVVRLEGGRRFEPRRWGLVPAWAKDAAVGARMINARAETLADKPAFREALRQRRCLVPADGFYEWRAGPTPRQPLHIRVQGGALFAMAGLYERWQPPDGAPPLESVAIVTTAPNDTMAAVHDRMPAILPPDDFATWLAPETPAADAAALLAPCPAAWLSLHPVSPRVNDVRVDDAACLAPYEEPQQSLF